MSFNGSGTFVVNTSGQPVVPNTVISATAFNALTNDLANGLSTCITKDGQTTPTANIPMGNNKITGLAPGTSGTDAANLSQVQGSTAKLLQSVTGTDTITAAMVPALTAYAAGQMFYFVAAGDNTGAVTINIDSLGAKSVTRDGSVALVAGDILSGEIALVVYDGTRFQLLNGNSFTNLNVSNNLTLSGGTANGVLYLNGSKVATSGSALTFDGTNLGIGTASPGVRLDVIGTQNVSGAASGTATGTLVVKGAQSNASGLVLTQNNSTDTASITNYYNSPLLFGTNATERGRFTAGGYFKASDNGTYVGSTSAYHEFRQSANDNDLYVHATNASFTNSCMVVRTDRAAGTSCNYFYGLANGANTFLVTNNGNVTNTNGSYGTISDAKMKTDIVDAGSQWDDIKAVRFRKFKMKNDPTSLVQFGLVAQELEQTSPGLVDEHTDRDAEGNDLGTTTKSVKTSVLLMKAAKALQEAMARIEQLEADMAALKGAQ